jgi:hypothetical protein
MFGCWLGNADAVVMTAIPSPFEGVPALRRFARLDGAR